MKSRVWIGALAALACTFSALSASAQDFVPGRPGATESAIAVPQGRWQIETEIASYAKEDDSDSESWSAFETTIRYGLARGWDAEAIVSPYNRVDEAGSVDEGFGDLTLRVRKTVKGLDGGPSLGFIGYITLPTAENGLGAEDVEGGVIAAGSFDLNETFELTWTAGLGAVSTEDDDYDLGVSGGAALGFDLTDKAGAYVELFADYVDDETAASFNVGATYLLAEETQIDAGLDFGLTDEADDVRAFIGWAHRF